MLPPAAGRSSSDAPRCCGQPSRPATRPEAQADWAQHPEPRTYLYRPRARPPGVPKAPNPSGPGWSGGGSPEPGVLSATSDERMYLRSAARAGQRSRQARTATLLHLASPCFKLNAAAESGSLLAPMGTGWSGTISGFDRCQDQRARLPIRAYASVLKLVRTPCFIFCPHLLILRPKRRTIYR